MLYTVVFGRGLTVEQLNADTTMDSVSVSLQMSLVKQLSGNWLFNDFYYVSSYPEIIISGFKAAGTLDIEYD